MKRTQSSLVYVDLTLAILAWGSLGVDCTIGITVTWTGLGANDNWNNSANWSNPPGNPPNFMDDAIVGLPAPTVLNVNGLVQSLEVKDGGLINMLGGNDLTITSGKLTNSGEIVVNSDLIDDLSSIHFSTTSSIIGKGKIVLSKPFVPGTPPFTMTRGATIESSSQISHSSNHTIEGTGRINATLINEGTIRALNPNGSGVLPLILAGNQQFNENMIASSPSGKLEILTTLITQGAAGSIFADGGLITLDNTQIVGGKLESQSGGQISVVGTNGAVLQGVINEATVNAGFFLGIKGANFTNNGAINGGTIRFDDSMSLDGTGEIILNSGNLQTLSAAVLTQSATHTIRGKGTLSAAMVNNGLIEVSPASGVPTPILTLSGFAKTNNHIIRALSGTVLDIASGIVLDQDSATGRLIAEDGVIQFNTNTGLSHGFVEATGTGRVEVRGSVSFTDITVEGSLNVRAQPTAQLAVLGSSLTNNGLVTVNPSTGNTTHTILFDGDSAMSLTGSGEIHLNHTQHRAQISIAAGKMLTQEANHKITGIGQINGNIINLGKIEGDSSTNLIDINGTLSGTNNLKNVRVNGTHSIGLGNIHAAPTFGTYQLTNSSILEFEIGGTNTNLFDTLFGETVNIDGTISIAQIDTGGGVFQPQLGDMFEIINATSVTGTFDSISILGLDPAIDYKVIYATDSVTLEAIRKYRADFDFDGDVDTADLTKWQAGYGMTGASHMDGDADEDGVVDGRDFLIWQREYGLGVPLVSGMVVPEPSCLWLVLIFNALVHRSRQERLLRMP